MIYNACFHQMNLKQQCFMLILFLISNRESSTLISNDI